jgi:hypothetical protein
MKNDKKIPKFLIAYYGLLQTSHLLVLIYAGFMLLGGETAPFPILPPPSGWQEQSMAFMFGLAGMDVIGIILGILFSYKTLIKQKFEPMLGILSLTIFISGAVIFGAGTYPSGAWAANPISYWVMVLLFAPSPYLYLKLLQGISVRES